MRTNRGMQVEEEPEAPKELVARLMQGSPLPLGEARSHIVELRALIAAGNISLRVVQYTWGLEFELVPRIKAFVEIAPDR